MLHVGCMCRVTKSEELEVENTKCKMKPEKKGRSDWQQIQKFFPNINSQCFKADGRCSSPWCMDFGVQKSKFAFEMTPEFFKEGKEGWGLGMDSGDFIKHTEPPLFGISKLLQTTVCNTHVIERCILYRGSLICTPLFTPYALCCGLYTALSPFSYSYLRKSESHSQAGSTSGLYNKKYAPYTKHNIFILYINVFFT